MASYVGQRAAGLCPRGASGRARRQTLLWLIALCVLAAGLSPRPIVASAAQLNELAPSSSQPAQVATAANPTVTLMATRVGMVGRTTANGHVITERDHFVALPSRRALSSLGGMEYVVQLSYR